MRLNRVFRFVLLLAAGGMVFQATSSCTSVFLETLATGFVQAAASAVTSSITDAVTSGTGT
jgi:hypothetical protein